MVKIGQMGLMHHAEQKILPEKFRLCPGTDQLLRIALWEDFYLLGMWNMYCILWGEGRMFVSLFSSDFIYFENFIYNTISHKQIKWDRKTSL